MSVSASTLAAVGTDVAESLPASGIGRLAIANGHGGNYVLANVVQQANNAGPRMPLLLGPHRLGGYPHSGLDRLDALFLAGERDQSAAVVSCSGALAAPAPARPRNAVSAARSTLATLSPADIGGGGEGI